MKLSTVNKAGLVLAFLLGLADLAALLQPTPDGEVGPPFAVLVLGAVLGLITLVTVVIAWRTGKRWAVHVTAGARVLSMLTALPAFFVDGVPGGIVALVAVFVVLTVLSVAAMYVPVGRPVAVTD